MNKVIALIVISLCIAYNANAADINPLTGEPIKVTQAVTKADAKLTTPTMPAPQSPYIPAPNMQAPYSPYQQTPQQPENKEIKPEERYVVDGIVNNTVTIKDQLNDEKLILLENFSMLDNGCLVKYPSILCGDQAKKAIKLNDEKDELSSKIIYLSKEIGAYKTKFTDTSTKLAESHKVTADQKTRLETMSTKVTALEKTLAEKQKAETEAAANKTSTTAQLIAQKKQSDIDLASIKTSTAAQLIAQQKQSDTDLASIKTSTAAQLIALKKQSDIDLATIKTSTAAQLIAQKKQFELDSAALKKQYETDIAALKVKSTEMSSTIQSIQPKLASTSNALTTCNTEIKTAMQDLSTITSILYKSPIGVDYNIPKLGKFKGVLYENLIYAFVPIESKEKADSFLKDTMLRAYKTDKYILYINNKKLVED